MILLPLLLALNASAAERVLTLKTIRTFPLGRTDSALTMIATPTKSAVNLWSLDTGKQIALYELPKVEGADSRDEDGVEVHAVAPDRKTIIVSHRHQFYNTAYAKAEDSIMSRAFHKVYLLSTTDEASIKTLYSFEGPCAHWYDSKPNTSDCPKIAPVTFFGLYDEQNVVDLIVHLLYEGHLNGKRYDGSREVALDLNGKKLFESERTYEYISLMEQRYGGSKKSYYDERKKFIDWVKSDSQTCALMKGEKRVSFLTDCSDNDVPGYYKGLVTSRNGLVFKAWDTATGALKTTIKAELPEGWKYGWWSYSDDGRFAWLLMTKDAQSKVEIWRRDTGEPYAVGSGPAFDGITAFRLMSDGVRGLLEKDDKTFLVDLGLGDAPTAPAAPAVARIDVDKLPPVAMKADPDSFAIVIGVEKYRSAGVPIVDYAARDAKTVAAYLGAMGFDAKNVAVLTDAEAGKVDFDKYFGKWLRNRVGPKSRVFIYYAGHGAPNPVTGAGYLMPYEADPSYLDESAYPIAQLYTELGKLPTKNVTVVLDACFSGQGERSLIAKGTRPLVAVQSARGPENATVITAASGAQVSASDHEMKHGLLTYSLLAGLHGEADANKDGKITTAELFSYARPAVERAAKLQNVEQTPTVMGESGAAGERVWVTFKKP